MPFSDHAFDLRKRSRCFSISARTAAINHIKKYGKEHGHHRWMCRDCGKTFSDRAGMVLYSAKSRPSQGGVLLRLGSRGLAGTGDSMDAFLGHIAPGSTIYHDMGYCAVRLRIRRKNVPLWSSENAFWKEQGKGLSFGTYRSLFYRDIFLSGKPSEDGMFTNMSNNFVYPFLKNKKIKGKRKNPC